MLGSTAEAEDAVQEAWLRLARSDVVKVNNLGGWLTTVVARICLDMLRSRKAHREEELGPEVAEEVAAPDENERDLMLADSVGLALLVVLDTLAPAERIAFVLHDMFDLPFEEIAPIVDRSPVATRQLASRARRRVRGVKANTNTDLARRNKIVEAFLAAARGGDFEALLTALDPDVVLRADRTAVQMGSPPELRGAAAVANMFKGRAQAARPMLVDGVPGVAVYFGGRLRIVLSLTFAGDRIAAIDAFADPDHVQRFEVTTFEGGNF
jgi:RNA polymerase sigma-70 factor (ECF subfamily)